MDKKSDNHFLSTINLDDLVGKTVGGRLRRNPVDVQSVGRKLYRSRGFVVCEKGVHRFQTHEEADQWMMKMSVARAINAAN